LLLLALPLQQAAENGGGRRLQTSLHPLIVVLEGSTVTLSCRYSKPVVGTYYFFWYQQYPGKPPKFLISHSDKGQLTSDPVSRLSVKVNETLMTLQISSAAATDSAVYYCAVRPTVTGNSKTLYKNLWSKDNRILHNIH
uniref:Ig-like domain-containing protein n=1 Tax=Maylandia zebra TaxID=106582 RepID=A0A3P9CDT8_9CICH